MYVLMVNGSPHRDGCTRTALDEIAGALAAEGIGSEIFWIGNDPLAGCIGCGSCARSGRCFRADAVNDFVEKARTADGFVFGSPVHYAAASGALTSFLDRAFMVGKPLGIYRHKPAAAVTSARRAGTTATLDQLNKYIVFHQMPLVPSQYWNMVHGSTPEQVRQDAEGLQIMRTLGRNMAWMLKAFAAAREAGIVPPEAEAPIRTSFIR